MAGSSPPSGEASPEILVVDDDEDLCEAMVELLEDAACRVRRAGSAEAALEILEQGCRPAAMIIDYGMSPVNGIELLKECRARYGLAGMPAVIMSGFPPEDLPLAGLATFLRKPFRSEDLVPLMHEVLGSALAGPQGAPAGTSTKG